MREYILALRRKEGMKMTRPMWYLQVEPNGYKVGEYDPIPSYTAKKLMEYVMEGVGPGGFLKAVLSNNLMDSINYADVANERALHSIVAWLWNHCPDDAQGSCEKYHKWIEAGGVKGREALREAKEAVEGVKDGGDLG
jgi:hypothetical protein